MKMPPPKPDQLTPGVNKPKTQAENVREFLKRYDHLRREMDELKMQVKDLEAEFEKEGLDIKTLKKAMRVLDIIASVQHKGTYDEMFAQLEKELVKSAA